MRKYKLTILTAVLFTIPLLGYFIVNGYWWLFDGNKPLENKMFASFILGLSSLFVNIGFFLFEDEQV